MCGHVLLVTFCTHCFICSLALLQSYQVSSSPFCSMFSFVFWFSPTTYFLFSFVFNVMLLPLVLTIYFITKIQSIEIQKRVGAFSMALDSINKCLSEAICALSRGRLDGESQTASLIHSGNEILEMDKYYPEVRLFTYL